MFLTNIFSMLSQQSKGSVNVAGFTLALHAEIYCVIVQAGVVLFPELLPSDHHSR